MDEDIFYTFRPDNARELKRHVEDAFPDILLPREDNITLYLCPCTECRDTRELFGGRHWREVAASGNLMEYYLWGGLPILSPKAWRFCLPAYLYVSLSGGDDAEAAQDCVLFSLSPERTGDSLAWFEERIGGLSLAQWTCLAAYTRAVSQSEPEDEDWEAIAAFWQSKAAGAEAPV